MIAAVVNLTFHFGLDTVAGVRGWENEHREFCFNRNRAPTF
jgi:hypothetical protein